jgi:large subunit ribosomal protein L30
MVTETKVKTKKAEAKPATKKASAKPVAESTAPVKEKVAKETKVAPKETKVAPKEAKLHKAAEAEKPTKPKANVKGGTIKVKQIASGAGKGRIQIATLKGLGLNKVNKEVEVIDTPSIRGMIKKVNHLIKVIS